MSDSKNTSRSDPYEYYHKGMSKLLSGEVVKKDYPMVDYVDVFVVDDIRTVFFRATLNSEDIDYKNMYKMGYDPHHLVDNYFRKYMKYFGIPTEYKDVIVTRNPNGEIIHVYPN